LKKQNKTNQDVNYYAIIPASVRYDKNLKANAKLLYGEITALSNEKGYCWAGNNYFANLYEVSKRTIQNWISNLEKNDYIKIRYKDIVKNGKNTTQRRIYLPEIANIKWGRNKKQGMKKSSPLKGMKKSSPQMDEKIFTPSEDNNPDDNSHQKEQKSPNITYNSTKTEEEEDQNYPQQNKTNIPDNVKLKFKQVFSRKLSSEFYKEVTDKYSDVKIIMKALEVSEANADKPSYLLKILSDWQNNGLTSISSINTYLEERKAKNQANKAKKETSATDATTTTSNDKRSLDELYESGYR